MSDYELPMPVFAPGELNLDCNQPQQTNAIGMLNGSDPWWKAANALLNASKDKLSPGVDFTPPIHFLALHCLECTLKSFLYAREIDETTLKRDFGHNLVRLLEKAQELEIGRLIDITPEMKARISLIAPDYGGKELQYFMGNRMYRWPLPTEILGDVGRIHDALDREYRAQSRVER
jgi:hypothetical protein